MALLLQTLNLWLQLRVIGAHWALTREIEAYCDATENAILAARSAGNDALADRLRERFERASGVMSISGSFAPPTDGNVSGKIG